MKKEIVEVFLETKNDEPIVTVKGRDRYTNPETLIVYLKRGVNAEEIKASTPKSEKGYTSYKFKVYHEGELNHYLQIKVKHSERYLHRPTIEKINEVCGISNLIKKVNVNRLIAGIAVGAIILATTGPTIVKGLKELFEKDYEYDQERYHKYSNSAIYVPTEEDRINADIEYYEELKERAKSGDVEAQKEYAAHLAEEALKEQIEEERSKTK